MKTVAWAVQFARAILARGSATRLAHRRPRGSREGWRPVALRWRRLRKRPAAYGRHVRTSPTAPVIWSPQVHLHVAAATPERAQPTAPIVVPGTSVMRQIHQHVRRVFKTINRSERADGPVRWLDRIVRADLAPAAAPPAIVTAPPLQRRAHRRGPLRAQPMSLSSRPARAAAAAPIADRRPFRATPVTTVTRSVESLQPGPAVMRQRTPHRHEVIPSPAKKPTNAAAPSYPPLDIVWGRRRLSSGGASEIEPISVPARSSTWNAPALHSSTESPAIAPQTQAPRPAPLKLTDVDPRLLDRLTDDVIRRVERRVRIERERRGL